MYTIILSASFICTKSIYIIVKYYFECTFKNTLPLSFAAKIRRQYQGNPIAGIYDNNGGIYTDEKADDGIYLHILRDDQNGIADVSVVTKKQFRELVDRHMNLISSDSTFEQNTLLSYVDPKDGKTYYSFDDGKTFQPLTDAEFEALYPTPDIEWWT